MVDAANAIFIDVRVPASVVRDFDGFVRLQVRTKLQRWLITRLHIRVGGHPRKKCLASR